MDRRPTLLSSCARAATTAEARFRINAPAFAERSSRVIALDGQAAEVLRDLAEWMWHGGHFLLFESEVPGDALLRLLAAGDGGDRAATALLSEELDGADTVVMVASATGSLAAASLIGDATAARGIMTVGLVLPGTAPVDAAMVALRPNAMVLVLPGNVADIPEILSALRV
jgi:hypothetical protein